MVCPNGKIYGLLWPYIIILKHVDKEIMFEILNKSCLSTQYSIKILNKNMFVMQALKMYAWIKYNTTI